MREREQMSLIRVQCTPSLVLGCFILLVLCLSSFSLQLEMITDLLGTPAVEDLCHITSSSAVKTLISQAKPAALSKLYKLSPDISHGAVHLLSQMLIFNPVSLRQRGQE